HHSEGGDSPEHVQMIGGALGEWGPFSDHATGTLVILSDDDRTGYASSSCRRSCERPSISTTFVRLEAPRTMLTRDRGTRASSAKKRMHSSLALPSTGGAARSSFQ